jgi:hypothetical protein
MELWVLYDVDEHGQINDVDAVTTDWSLAEMWQRESDCYRAQKYRTEDAAEYVAELFEMNFNNGHPERKQ